MSIWLICLILFQANQWVEVTPGGTAPTVRNEHSAVWNSITGGLWVFGGGGGPLLSAVDHAYSTYWKSVREIRFGKAASFKKWGTGRKNDLHYYDVTVLLVVSGWWLGLECWDVVKSRDSSRFSSCENAVFMCRSSVFAMCVVLWFCHWYLCTVKTCHDMFTTKVLVPVLVFSFCFEL